MGCSPQYINIFNIKTDILINFKWFALLKDQTNHHQEILHSIMLLLFNVVTFTEQTTISLLPPFFCFFQWENEADVIDY